MQLTSFLIFFLLRDARAKFGLHTHALMLNMGGDWRSAKEIIDGGTSEEIRKVQLDAFVNNTDSDLRRNFETVLRKAQVSFSYKN